MVAVESAHAPVELDQEQEPRWQFLFLIRERPNYDMTSWR
jgi:hypothetical protein